MLIIFKNKNKYRIFEKKNMIKAGVVGAGHLGSIHLKLLNESKYFELIGYHDINKDILDINDNFIFFEKIENLIDSWKGNHLNKSLDKFSSKRYSIFNRKRN